MAYEDGQKEQTGHLHTQVAGDRVHFCSSCVFPIAVYGRLAPCLHAFCLACATDMEKCFICNGSINRIERVEGEVPLFVSTITLQSFKTEDDLMQHTKRVYSSLLSVKDGQGFDVNLHQKGAAHRPVPRPP